MSISTSVRHVLLFFICFFVNAAVFAHKPLVSRSRSEEVRHLFKRAPSTCPVDPSLIAPCTCSLNKTSKNGLPELSCINFNGGGDLIPLDQIFKNLTDYLEATGDSDEYERLLLVNSQTRSINETLFHGLKFRYMSIYETNLTDVGPASFMNMPDTMVYLLIKGDRLRTVFSALTPLKNLTTLILNLGLHSFQQVPSNALVDMPALRRVTMNGVANTIQSNAFVNLPSLELIKVTNQLERIASNAFDLQTGSNQPATGTTRAPIRPPAPAPIPNRNSASRSNNRIPTSSPISVAQSSSDSTPTQAAENNTSNATQLATTAVNIDLSNNKLDENSFGDNFIVLRPEQNITLDLTYNWIRFLPESIFMPFFEVNEANNIVLVNNKFECGRCDSYWIIRNSSLIRGRLDVNCYMNNQLSIWDYDWSHCLNSNNPNGTDPGNSGSASNFLKAPTVILAVVIQLLLVLFVR